MNGLLSILNHEGSLSLGEAAIYALLGFLIVFIGIVIIIFVIWLVGLIMRKTDNLSFLSKKKKKLPKEEVTEAVLDDSEEIPDEVKAAIIAAIMAYYTKEAPKCDFKVKRIKRI